MFIQLRKKIFYLNLISTKNNTKIKNIKISLDKNTIYAADNLGYLYAININSVIYCGHIILSTF